MAWNDFVRAEDRVFERFGISPERLRVLVPSLGGDARVVIAGNGPPVLMVIGAGPPAALWAPLMAELSGLTLHVVDPPGMGLTPPVHYTTAAVRETAVRFLDEVCEGLGLGRVPVIGQSVGGLWSIWLALDRPERVSALVLVACPALLFGNSAPLVLRLLSVPVLGAALMRLQPPSPRQVDRMAALAGEDFSDHPELRDLWVELERLPGSGRALRELIHANEDLHGARPEIALTEDQLARLQLPVQLVWGSADPFGPPILGRRAAAILPRGEIHVVPGGHAPWLRQPARIAGLIAPFLRAHGAPRERISDATRR